MATARSVSPGGALLRASRMFSIPTPLPPCPTTSPSEFRSDTATQNFPTHQIITTLESSRKQGDWGLKRPLPLRKTTKSTQAMIRVKHVDSAEQVTDYASATDHGLTLQKFQELRLPVTELKTSHDGLDQRRMGAPGKSVFENDTTDPAADIKFRWKFQGPWLAGITLGKFNKWLEKEARPRRVEFHAFLKEKIAAQKLDAAQKEALDQGLEVPETVDPSSITDEQVTDYLRKLRTNDSYHELYKTVGQFLDLAPLEPPPASALNTGALNLGSRKTREDVEVKSENPYAARGPPATHPSAGISYLRTNMYLDNHPVYGPQAAHPPIKARVLKPKKGGYVGGGRIGAAGFVANNPFGDSEQNHSKGAMQNLDPNVEGGAKFWVHPLYAHVDSLGRVRASFGDIQDQVTRLVAEESIGETKVFGEKPEEEPRGAAKIRRSYAYKSARMSSAESYGINGTGRPLLTLKEGPK
ncbi:Mitochondrial ribosomal protein MRP51 [Naviculisporaceae sp. PSN 640]